MQPESRSGDGRTRFLVLGPLSIADGTTSVVLQQAVLRGDDLEPASRAEPAPRPVSGTEPTEPPEPGDEIIRSLVGAGLLVEAPDWPDGHYHVHELLRSFARGAAAARETAPAGAPAGPPTDRPDAA